MRNNTLIQEIALTKEDAEDMQEKDQRKDPRNSLDLDKPERFIITEPEPVEIASGYSISVKYDIDGRPIIYVKKYGEVETKGLRREIERNYPGAAIQGLEKPKLIEIDEDLEDKPSKSNVKDGRKRI